MVHNWNPTRSFVQCLDISSYVNFYNNKIINRVRNTGVGNNGGEFVYDIMVENI